MNTEGANNRSNHMVRSKYTRKGRIMSQAREQVLRLTGRIRKTVMSSDDARMGRIYRFKVMHDILPATENPIGEPPDLSTIPENQRAAAKAQIEQAQTQAYTQSLAILQGLYADLLIDDEDLSLDKKG